MKEITIPILNSEYTVTVFLGTEKELVKIITKEAEDYTEKDARRVVSKTRGAAFNRFNDDDIKSPFIVINTEMPFYMALGTLAHEASHAVFYIEEFISIIDRNDEFRGHSVGAIVRTVVKALKLKDETTQTRT